MGFREGMTPEELTEFEAWAKHQRETTLAAMADSAIVVSVYKDVMDVEYALQVGAAVLYGKPLLVLAQPGQELPPKLLLVADQVLEVSLDDVDTGSQTMKDGIAAFMRDHGLDVDPMPSQDDHAAYHAWYVRKFGQGPEGKRDPDA